MIKSWSFSAWELWKQCPRKYKCSKIDHLPDPPGRALLEGNRIHDLAQAYVEGRMKTLPPELRMLKKQFAILRKRGATCEAKRAYTDKWAPTEWDARDAYLRLKKDAEYVHPTTGVLHIVDYKTGNWYPSHSLQLELSVVAGLIDFPDVTEVEAHDWYTKTGREEHLRYARSSLDHLKKIWENRTLPMFEEVEFLPVVNQFCGNCNFKKGCPAWTE